MSPADDRKLVKVVECHHVLWDNRMKEFRDKRLTQLGWKSVSEILGREVDDVMHRWGSLRKQYSRKITRMRQKKGNESPEKPWHLMPLLSFMRPCITPRRKNQSNARKTSSTSSEDIYSSSQSDDSRESSPLVVRLNPVEPPKNSLFYDAPERRTLSQFGGIKRPLLSKPKTAVAVEKQDIGQPTVNKQEENIVEPLSPPLPPKIPKLLSSVPKSVTVLKSQYVDVKPPQTPLRRMVPKSKKFKSSTVPVPKSNNTEIKKVTKTLPSDHNAVARCANASLETEKKPNVSSENYPAVKNINMSSETEKTKITSENAYVVNSVNKPPEAQRSREYDSEEHFLLSLASDLRKMPPKQKYEAKIKIINVFADHIKSEFNCF